MNPNEVHAQLDQVQLVDVREAEEWHVFLIDRDYRADDLDGGLQAWADAGLPVRAPDSEQPGKVG